MSKTPKGGLRNRTGYKPNIKDTIDYMILKVNIISPSYKDLIWMSYRFFYENCPRLGKYSYEKVWCSMIYFLNPISNIFGSKVLYMNGNFLIDAFLQDLGYHAEFLGLG